MIPLFVIILTGSMNEETAVECMRAGATDYVIKEQIKRLPFAIKEAGEKENALGKRSSRASDAGKRREVSSSCR